MLSRTRCIHSDGIPGDDSGYIYDVNNVFNAIKHHFENSYNHVRKKAGSNPIDHFHFFSYLLCDENPIEGPAVGEEFDHLEGMSISIHCKQEWMCVPEEAFMLVSSMYVEVNAIYIVNVG